MSEREPLTEDQTKLCALAVSINPMAIIPVTTKRWSFWTVWWSAGTWRPWCGPLTVRPTWAVIGKAR
jgi:hypothetical protein